MALARTASVGGHNAVSEMPGTCYHQICKVNRQRGADRSCANRPPAALTSPDRRPSRQGRPHRTRLPPSTGQSSETGNSAWKRERESQLVTQS